MQARESDDRRPVQGAPNFRDLGGLPTDDGRSTRFGQLFRSGGLEELTPTDIDYLVAEVGIRTVLDLRSKDDTEPAEALVATPVRVVNLPIIRKGSSTSLTRPMGPDGRVDVPFVYQMFMEMSVGSIQAIFEELTSGATPAVFHCVAGKDRTGVVAALILALVGVTREAVIADFMASEPALDDIVAYMRRRPAYTDVVLKLPPGTMDTEPNYMSDYLDYVDKQYGGIHEWLTGPARISAATLSTLEDLLVERQSKE